MVEIYHFFYPNFKFEVEEYRAISG